jgi:uncharacterized membrane protein
MAPAEFTITNQREYLKAMTDLDAILFVWGTRQLRRDLAPHEQRQAEAMARAIEQWEFAQLERKIIEEP